MATTTKLYLYCSKCVQNDGKICADCSTEWQWRSMKKRGWDRPPKHFKEKRDAK